METTRRRLASISFFLANWPSRSTRCSSRMRAVRAGVLPSSAVAASPSSIALARMTSCSAVNSGTLPISLRYIRTGSLVGAFSANHVELVHHLDDLDVLVLQHLVDGVDLVGAGVDGRECVEDVLSGEEAAFLAPCDELAHPVWLGFLVRHHAVRYLPRRVRQCPRGCP